MIETEFVIGLTGPIGGGCTRAATWLASYREFEHILLSEPIRRRWHDENGQDKEPSRADLQKLGDQIREEFGPAALVDLTLSKLGEEGSWHPRLVVDSIRNLGEISELRKRFGQKFTLVGVVCDPETRYERIGTDQYRDGGQAAFLADDQRDTNEETATGQQVQLCIDRADILIDNSKRVPLSDFHTNVDKYTNRILGEEQVPPSLDEIYMQLAYASSHGSRCIKRTVGAVLIRDGEVVATGFNENPTGTHPCVEEPTYGFKCFRDIIRDKRFLGLAEAQAKCPVCGNPIEGPFEGPPWRCEACGRNGVRTNLESYHFPDRAMSWCTAVHAETAAILAAGERARGSELYCTTFPCMQCAEKVIQAGIRRVEYTEAYPDVFGVSRLALAKIETVQFEGVRSSSAFERIYPRFRQE